jgi:hypothetical protein
MLVYKTLKCANTFTAYISLGLGVTVSFNRCTVSINCISSLDIKHRQNYICTIESPQISP